MNFHTTNKVVDFVCIADFTNICVFALKMVKIVDSVDSDWQSNIVVKQDFFDDFTKSL